MTAYEEAVTDLIGCAATAMELASDPNVSDAEVRCYVAVSLSAAAAQVQRAGLAVERVTSEVAGFNDLTRIPAGA